MKHVSKDLHASQSKTNDRFKGVHWERCYKESELSGNNQSSLQTQHSDQSTQGDFLVIHRSIRQGSALHTLIRFPIQCAPGLALLGLSRGDVRRLNDSRQALWQASRTHCPFNSSDRTTVNSPSRRPSLSGMYPSKLGGAGEQCIDLEWLALISGSDTQMRGGKRTVDVEVGVSYMAASL